MLDLGKIRDEIDVTDDEIVRLFQYRMALTAEVAQYKIETGKAVFDAERERQKLEKLTGEGTNAFNTKGIQELFQQIMSISRKRQYQLLTENGGEEMTDYTQVDHLPTHGKRVVFQGVEGAYKAVMKPTEGTMLTVARVAGEKAAESTEQDAVALWALVCEAARDALAHTPEQLPVLKKAGVVDAGGQGLVYIFDGMLSVFRDGKLIAADEPAEKKAKVSSHAAGRGVFTDDLMKVEDIKNGYCTQFLVNKNEGASSAKLRAFLESNGDSVVVIEDDEVINCHVHTADPGKIISHAIEYGYLTNFKIENMHEQFLARQKQGEGLKKQAEAEEKAPSAEFPYAAVDPERTYGFVAVAAGEGLKAVFMDLGADAVVSGGQTMNPATADILAAVQSVPAKTVFVLPNNKNIIMAAEQAQKLADRTVVVLPTRTIPQGITAMLNFDPEADAGANAVAMQQAADKVATGLVTFAARDSDFDGRKIKKGEILALENGKLVATGTDITKTTYRLARSMCKKDTSFITVISGCDVSEEDAARTAQLVQAKCPSGIEVTQLAGGQPVYYYIISVE